MRESGNAAGGGVARANGARYPDHISDPANVR
jgi:hypothetical protein